MESVPVSRFEYRFPTDKGGNEIITHNPADLVQGLEVIAGVLRPLESGAFLPTTDSGDCKYCEHRDTCRVSGGEEGYEKADSPRAEWAEEFGAGSAHYAPMIARRSK